MPVSQSLSYNHHHTHPIPPLHLGDESVLRFMLGETSVLVLGAWGSSLRSSPCAQLSSNADGHPLIHPRIHSFLSIVMAILIHYHTILTCQVDLYQS